MGTVYSACDGGARGCNLVGAVFMRRFSRDVGAALGKVVGWLDCGFSDMWQRLLAKSCSARSHAIPKPPSLLRESNAFPKVSAAA